MLNGTVDIANASRSIKAEELAQASKEGMAPVEFEVARDAIAVVVNPHNPVNRLTLQHSQTSIQVNTLTGSKWEATIAYRITLTRIELGHLHLFP